MTTLERRLGHMADVLVSNVDKHAREGELPVRLCNYTDVYHNEAVHPDLQLMEATATPEEIARFRLRTGDTVFTKDSETADDIGIPAYVTADSDDFVCGYHLAIARPDPTEVHPKYLFWWLNSREAAQLWQVRASGVTRVGLRQTDIRQLPMVIVSDLSEQRTIADFLDRETAQIDAMVNAQERLVALLEEYLSAYVAHVATTGVDRPTAVRPSGHGWIGTVPAGWSLAPLGRVFRERSVTVSDRDFPALSVTKAGIVPQLETAAKTDNGDNRKKVCAGDFVINSRSDRKGSSGVSPTTGSVSLISIVLEPRDIEGRYAHHLLRSVAFQEEFYRFGSGIVADLWSTRYSAMRRITLPLPPIEEQRRIAEHLDHATARIGETISKARESIALMKERRAALISAAVTGRIDVRTGIEQVERDLEEARA